MKVKVGFCQSGAHSHHERPSALLLLPLLPSAIPQHVSTFLPYSHCTEHSEV